MRSVPLGLCEDYPEESRSIAAVARDVDVMRQAGVTTLRVSIGWDGLEPVDDRFDWRFWDDFVQLLVVRSGIRLIPYVAYTPQWAAGAGADAWKRPPRDPAAFRQVMRALSERYAGLIDSWELWNEPDNRDYWLGTNAQYVELLRAGAAGVRAGNPRATVVFGGIAGGTEFLAQAFASGAWRDVDVVNVHAYFETWNPDPLEQIPAYLDQVQEIVRRHGDGEAIWVAEVGYSDHRQGGRVAAGVEARFAYEHTPDFQAVALTRVFAMALSHPATQLLAWYELKDLPTGDPVIGDVNNRHLGVTDPTWRPKPALAALRFMTDLFGRGYRVLAAPSLQVRASTDVHWRAFALADGRRVLMTWLPTRSEPWNRARDPKGQAVDPRAASVEVDLPDAPAAAPMRHDARGGAGAAVAVQPLGAGARLSLSLTGGEQAVVIWR